MFYTLACPVVESDGAMNCNDGYESEKGPLENLLKPPRKIWWDLPFIPRGQDEKVLPSKNTSSKWSFYMTVEDSAPESSAYHRVICKLSGIEVVMKPLAQQTPTSAGYLKKNADGSDQVQCKCWRQKRMWLPSPGSPWEDEPGSETACGP